MEIWAKTKEYSEGKFLVVRRDGTVPNWPHFVIGARDPAAPAALREYAEMARSMFGDHEYADSILELATDFEKYRQSHGDGDPESGPHRKDDPSVIDAMRNPGCLVELKRIGNPDVA
jgi:hypothetical protein